MNTFILAFIFTLIFVSIVVVRKKPSQHFLFISTLIIYFIYIFLGPLNRYINSDYYIFGNNFESHFTQTILLYTLGLFSFVITYGLTYVNKKNRQEKRFKLIKNYYLPFALILIISLVSFLVIGPKSSLYNYTIFFVDSLIISCVVLYFENKKGLILYLSFFCSIVLSLILGFRYRIILLLIFIIYIVLLSSKFNLKLLLKSLLLLLFVSYTLNFISINRRAFIFGNYSDLNYSFEQTKTDGFGDYVLDQTNNFSADASVVKYLDQRQESFDFGNTIILQTIIRFVPKFFFENNQKPEIPQQRIIRNSFNTDQGYSAGAAITNIISYYLAFGVLGVIFFMAIIGYLLAYFSRKYSRADPIDKSTIVMITMVLFQEISRGFFPQTFTLICFIYLPLKLLYKKIYN